ncbi:MAG TPA: LacI family DNA-binding transcriptional regulator [Geminicoccaceae bacterium]|nr:LacI family DNA-binding transcriptional regulator [Geminicoccus sp.]HMU49960.1 LacI family DNA-binding transcriptional regulator [Geminicoccaceae bacterium]
MRNDREAGGPRLGPLNIADVAALAGVSIATVSRSLTNPERVSRATRERVLEVVRQTGYTPNVAGRNLRVARSMSVLVVVPSLITVFFSALLLGVDRALSAEGYGLLVGNLHDGPDKEARLVDLVLSGQADGVLLLNGHVPRGPLRSMTDSHAPVVAVSVPSADGVPAVLVREREAAAAVARHLLELGHRRFGYVTGPATNYIEHERWAGFRDALAAAGIAEAAIRRYPGDFRLGTGVAAGESFLRGAGRPSAVFAVSDEMAIGFIRAVRDGGLEVPRDVSVAGFDGIEFADYCEPRLTTVRQPREQMGKAAAEILVRMMRGETIPADSRRLWLDGELRVGGSTAPTGRDALPDAAGEV